MADRSTIITPPGDTAWIYDPQHDALRFVSKANATLYTYDLAQGGFTAPLSLGGTPNSLAITPDGQTLVVGNSDPVAAAIVVTRVNLAIQAVDQVRAPLLYASELGVAHIAVDGNGQVVFGTLTGAPANSYRTFAAGSPSPNVQVDLAFTPIDGAHGRFAPWSFLLSSPDHRFLLVQDPSSGPSFEAVYDTASASFVAVNNLARDFNELPLGIQTGRGDVSNSGLIVDVTYNDVRVFNTQLHLVKNLSSLTAGGSIAGAAFSEDARELFLWNAELHSILVIDTQTWAQIATLQTTLGGSVYNNAPAHDMQVVEHGTMLAIDDGARVELIDLTARLHLVSGPPAGSPDPNLPIAPTIAGSVGSTIVGDMDRANLADLGPAIITVADENGFAASDPSGLGVSITGSNFVYLNNQLVGGTVHHITFNDVVGGVRILSFDGGSTGLPAAQFFTWLVQNNTLGAFQTVLGGNDSIVGGRGADLIHGYAGDDAIYGLGGADTLYGGLGNDVIQAITPPNTITTVGAAGATYLRGEEGDDYIVGGSAFDDINGNMGNDTCSGGLGDDWVVGGKDNDMLFGDGGDDIVYGNLGDDTCVGGQGADLIRGGQGDDQMYGGDGNDWLSGDRGNDTITGGAGADTFHTFSGAGIDRVLDFNLAEGDRVQVDPGTTWTVGQVGADTVIDMGHGDQMILVGVQADSLTGAWIFGA